MAQWPIASGTRNARHEPEVVGSNTDWIKFMYCLTQI